MKKKRKAKVVEVRISGDLQSQLEKIAKYLNLPVSTAIRFLVTEIIREKYGGMIDKGEIK